MLLRECNSSNQSIQRKPDTVTVVDTAYITKTNTKIKKVLIASTDSSYDIAKDPRFVPDTSYETLKVQFAKLSKDYTARNIYKDTLVLDSIGFVHVTDSVQFNTLLNRHYTYSYKLPIVTKTTTITNYPKQVRQLYAGVGINSSGINSINAGLMYKSRRDQLYGFTLGVNNNQLVYGFQTYFKIKLKK
jgi:hypothetical protein